MGVDEDLRELLGDGPAPFPATAVQEFHPWHRPRKQYVRAMQWAREIGFLARDLSLDNRELRYLTLPGSDLLDIRHIAGTICAQRNVTLRYLGFNTAADPGSAAQPELNSAHFSIKRLEDAIHPESEVFQGDLRMVGVSRSVTWNRVRSAGPFHVVNLDLCGGFAGSEKTHGIPNYFTALKAILQQQATSDEEFLLFITTRMDDDNVDPATSQVLSTVAQRIYDACAEYAAEFATAWEIPADGPVTIREHAASSEAFLLGLTQWIVAQGVQVGLRATVKSFMTYRTGSDAGEDDIASLAIRFRPDPYIQNDEFGLVAAADVISETEKECQQSSAIPSRVRARHLVDDILRSDFDAFQRCLEDSTRLLEAAGYDPVAYRDWVMIESDRYAAA